MTRFLIFSFCLILSFPLQATTFVPQGEGDILKEAEILCAVEVGTVQFILKDNRVFSRAPLKTLECFVGDLPSNAVLEWPGGRQSFTHENGTTETITTQIPGLPVIQKGDLKIFSLLQDQNANLPLFNLKSWTYLPTLERNSDNQIFILEQDGSPSFLPSPARSKNERKSLGRSERRSEKQTSTFRPQFQRKSLADYRQMVERERKSKPE